MIKPFCVSMLKKSVMSRGTKETNGIEEGDKEVEAGDVLNSETGVQEPSRVSER